MLRLKPTYIAEHLTDINLDDLKASNIKGIIFDLDNTIMHPNTSFMPEEVEKWLEVVKKDFKITIVSNNPRAKYVKDAGEKVGCSAYGKAGKPRRKKTRIALEELDLLPCQAVIIGDRPLTDVWVGQRLGIMTILVDPLLKHQEMWIIKVLRKLERVFISSAEKSFS